MLVLGTTIDACRSASAQTPTTPPAEQGQAPSAEPQQIPLQQFPIQQPGRPPVTPATPPSTTIPPWTPPMAPPPSQTNIPSPFPYATPGAPGAAPGTPGFFGGIPNLTVPGAFAPAVTTVRGATLEFHPTARTALEYSDNFFQTSSRAEDNFRSILGPGFTLLLNGARTFGTLSTTVDLVHDTAPDSGDEIKVFPSLNLALRYALTPRLALTLADTFIRNDAAATADQFGIRRGRQTFDINTLSLTADWLIDLVATQAYYRNVLFFNEDDGNRGQSGQLNGSNREDTITHILGLNAATRFAENYIVRGGYEFSYTDEVSGGNGNGTGNGTGTSHTVFASVARQLGLYTSAGISSSFQYQLNESTKIYNASLFGAYGLPTGLSLSASVGYSILDSDENDNEGTVSANVNASYRFARAAISVGVFQDFRQTAQQGQNFGTVETRTYFGSFLYQLTPFINAVLNASYSENSPTGTGNVNNSGTQKALTYGAAVNWQILRWLTASLQYTYTKQTGTTAFDQSQSSFGNGDFAENRAILSLFATF
jgi:hypothetical protein